MAASDKELEKLLMEVGNKLLDPPPSVEELLPLLDQVEDCLSKVEQSPPMSMQNALSPSLKALVTDKLLKHSDADVKVSVAACISEITRITAPDAPYDDDHMKEVFQLIVSSFENLVDKSSRSYGKRTSILETVAKVRSCVVMLDLECDALITEMFQHFLKAIRDYHPENVVSSMETIMTLVFEESEDISQDLLSPVLDYLQKDNEDVLPISRKLVERVLQSCATKLKPYLNEAVKYRGLPLDKFSNVVASICQGTAGAMEQNVVAANEKIDSEGNLERESAPEQEKEKPMKVTAAKLVAPDDGSLKSVVSNGVPETGDDHSLAESESRKKQEDGALTNEPKEIGKSSNVEKLANAEQEEEQQTREKKGRKTNSVKQTESSKTSSVDEEIESKKLPDSKDVDEDVPSSPHVDPSVNMVISSENEETKPLEDESATVASLSRSENLPDETRTRKDVHQKKKGSSTKENKPSADDASKIASEGPSDSEAKETKKSGKKAVSGSSSRNRSTVSAPKKGSRGTSNSEAKTVKQPGKKVDADSSVEESSKLKEDKKKQGRGKATSDKDAPETSSEDDDKLMVSSPKSATKLRKDEQTLEETPKENSKRKRSLGEEKVSDVKEFGENLIGSRIKVWWPKDHAFYEGVVDSFDAAKKKHLVLYDDGDQEILNLKRQKWEFNKDDSESTEEETADQKGPDATSEMPQKKKTKTGNDQSAKQKKMDASAKRGGTAATSKSKATATKSGKKSKDDEKPESKKKDSSKATSKPETDSDDETEDDERPKSGKAGAAASKPTGKSKNAELSTTKSGTKASGKSKEETPKNSRSKQESAKPSSFTTKGKTGRKSNLNGSGKSKSGVSSKGKESDDEESADTPKARETSSKGKSPGSAKSQGSQAKSGKKRKR